MRGSQTENGVRLLLSQTCTQERPCPLCCNVHCLCQSGMWLFQLGTNQRPCAKSHRSGCQVISHDTTRSRSNHLDRTDRLCLVCKSLDCVEDEQHFVFCPAYSHIRSQHLDLLQHCFTIADFMSLCKPNACGGFLRECFACRK